MEGSDEANCCKMHTLMMYTVYIHFVVFGSGKEHELI